VFIFGIDCDPQAVELIDSGTMYKGCVDTNPVGTGELAADAFALWLAGGSVPGIIEVPVFVYTGEEGGPATTAADGTGPATTG
jgi:ABC-type sugar transport system substrate-binding protein